MSYGELPNPPTGSVTCEANQYCEIEVDDDGRVEVFCRTPSSTLSGAPLSTKPYMSGGLGKGLVIPGFDDQSSLEFLNVHGIEYVKVVNRYIPVYVLDQVLRTVVSDARPFGGFSIEKAVAVGAEERFIRTDRTTVKFKFPEKFNHNEPDPSLMFDQR
tara:strand:- start:11 stop:484 length:474 start_codon:yes stop_codon:yes gene_type:complete